MNEEITKRDRARTKIDTRHTYGRGSKVVLRYYPQDMYYRLVESKGEFWTAINPNGRLETISVNDISKVLVDGHWINFDPGPRNWKKLS